MSRIIRNAVTLLLIFATGGWVFWDKWMAVSVVSGGLLALVNWSWMSAGVDRMLLRSGGDGSVRFALLYVLRLALITGALFAIIHPSWVSPKGALVGLSAPVAAGMLEALFLAVRR